MKKEKLIKTLTFLLLIISMFLVLKDNFKKEERYNLSFEYINIKDMAEVKSSNKEKTNKETNSLVNFLSIGTTTSEIDEINIPKFQEVSFTGIRKTENYEVPRRIWYLPTQIGSISQNPHYGHVALDITSPRGSNELIFPVANGTISSIYRDGAGALIVTVLHNVNGKKYTSQYVHLSSYANGLYVGKPVTVNDCLGKMGTTGYSTGVHLHFALVDCALFDPNDPNCSDLNGFFRYGRYRLGQGYMGLGSMMNVPGSWSSR